MTFFMKNSLTGNHVLSSLQKEILVGSLLGDGHLETLNQGKNYRFIVVQSSKKPVYFQFLYDHFQNFIKTPIYTRVYSTQQGKSSTKRFVTQFSSEFTSYGEMFYVDKIKRVPLCIEQILTPLGLAVWYMDDGSLKSVQSKGVYLNTHGFSVADIERLCNVLKTKFHIDAWKRPDSGSYRIYISGKSYERLKELVTPYFTEDMWYKWPSPRKSRQSNK